MLEILKALSELLTPQFLLNVLVSFLLAPSGITALGSCHVKQLLLIVFASGCTEWSLTHSAAAAAKSLQSCPTLCDAVDSSPPGSPIPGILQARTLEWVAISFSNAWKWKVKVKSLSHVQLLATHGLQPTRLLRPWDFPGKRTEVGCHHLLRWPTQLHPKAARLLTFTATVAVSLLAFQGCSRATEVGMGRGQVETPHHLWAVLTKIQLLFLNNSP